MSMIYVAITIPGPGCWCGCNDPRVIGAFSTEDKAKEACQAAQAADHADELDSYRQCAARLTGEGKADEAARAAQDAADLESEGGLVLGWREEPEGSGYWVASDDGFETRGGRAFTVTAHELDAMPAPEPAAAATA